MDKILSHIKLKVFDKCELNITDYQAESESKEYDASQFQLNGFHVLSRNAKITPKKIGQFVTFWKRNGDGPIEPFEENDLIDFYVVNVQREEEIGQFVFPKSTLIEKGIISTKKKEGKRAFRVYPNWDTVKSKQAERTQKWQLNYFYRINESSSTQRAKELFHCE